ncbi:MAG: hypothetical protein KAU50_01895 [Candidatus Marinimicrobia bacterium]|nr:hypothetical protein [Candidatus Neomarinimicrobiota bacterium]
MAQRSCVVLVFALFLQLDNDILAARTVQDSSSDSQLSRGIEFNPAGLLLYSAMDDLFFSGGFSSFYSNRNIEIAFPIIVYRGDDEDSKYQEYHFACHYRHFIGEKVGGFYFSGGLHYKYAHYRYNENWWYFDSFEDHDIKFHKLGLSFGIGFRYISKKRFFWGTSIFAGRYFTGTSDAEEINSIGEPGGKLLLGTEILKFGILFK